MSELSQPSTEPALVPSLTAGQPGAVRLAKFPPLLWGLLGLIAGEGITFAGTTIPRLGPTISDDLCVGGYFVSGAACLFLTYVLFVKPKPDASFIEGAVWVLVVLCAVIALDFNFLDPQLENVRAQYEAQANAEQRAGTTTYDYSRFSTAKMKQSILDLAATLNASGAKYAQFVDGENLQYQTALSLRANTDLQRNKVAADHAAHLAQFQAQEQSDFTQTLYPQVVLVNKELMSRFDSTLPGG